MNDETPPNIVLVTIDSLRADHCGHWGYERVTTPALDAMAEEGTVAEHAIAPGPATPESMPAIFTGSYPVERPESDDDGLAGRRERIRQHMGARESLPERLSRLGYETAAFTPNPFTSRHFGFEDGFDHFEDFMDESTRGRLYQRVFRGFLEESGLSSLARVFLNVWQREEVFKPWESYYDDVVAWAESASEPYFLWVFLMDAHNPYLASREYRTQSALSAFHANVEFWRQSHETPFGDGLHRKLVTAYDDSIRYSDAFLERLNEDLAGDDPVVAVHGDHGEAFGEHGTYGHEPYLYPENVHVPFVLAGDGIEDRTIDRPVSLRTVPDVLTALARNDALPIPTDDVVFARTRQGDRTSIHRRDGGWIRSGDGQIEGLGRFATTDGGAGESDAHSGGPTSVGDADRAVDDGDPAGSVGDADRAVDGSDPAGSVGESGEAGEQSDATAAARLAFRFADATAAERQRLADAALAVADVEAEDRPVASVGAAESAAIGDTDG